MRRLLGLLGWRDVVYVGHHDGDYFLRVVRYGQVNPGNPFADEISDTPRFFVYGYIRQRTGTLLASGAIDKDGSYMVRWKPYRVKSRELLALYEAGRTARAEGETQK